MDLTFLTSRLHNYRWSAVANKKNRDERRREREKERKREREKILLTRAEVVICAIIRH